MEDLKIVFMGTPDFAVASLKAMIEKEYHVVGVITAPDRPAGRGQQLKQSAVKEYALSQGLFIMQPTNLKDKNFVTQLASLKANVQVVVAFRMLPEIVWKMPAFGTFNLHASLLPSYRGAAPINWAIINGEEMTGVTTFFIDDKIDTGAIIDQKKNAIRKNDNAGTLHDKLMELGASLVLETLQKIKSKSVSTTIQPKATGFKTAYKLTKENTRINWKAPGSTIYDFVRGLSPYPTAWTLLKNNDKEFSVKIFDIEFIEEKHDVIVGKIKVEDKIIKVAVKDGFVIINKLQLPGKKMMTAKALLNGYQFDFAAELC